MNSLTRRYLLMDQWDLMTVMVPTHFGADEHTAEVC